MKRIARKTKVGGQAVFEGLVMKGPKNTCMAVRKPDGTIYQEVRTTKPNPVRKIPFVRGVYSMLLSLSDGVNYITKSSDMAFPDGDSGGAVDRWLDEKLGDKGIKSLGVVARVLGGLLGIALFVLLPTLLTGGLNYFMNLGPWKSVVEGVSKMLIFLGYMFFATRLKDIHRVFEYHGAEHKTINCYENFGIMTVEGVRKHSRFHPRCGTSYIFIVLLVSILIFSFVPWGSTWERTLLKLVSLPVVMGLSYEVLMFAGSRDNCFFRALSAPGKWVQRLTTFEPDDAQIEVAIAAFLAVEPEAVPPCREDSAQAQRTSEETK